MFFDHMEISNKKTTKKLLNIKKFNNGPVIHSSKKKSQRKLKNKTKQTKTSKYREQSSSYQRGRDRDARGDAKWVTDVNFYLVMYGN